MVTVSGSLGQEGCGFIPGAVVFFLCDQPWCRRRHSEDLRIIIELNLVSGKKGRGCLANPLFLLSGAFEPYRTLDHGIFNSDLGKSRGRREKIAGACGFSDNRPVMQGAIRIIFQNRRPDSGSFYNCGRARRGQALPILSFRWSRL